nr:pathogenesis-related protein PRMS-like [Ipomoea batatas]
MAKGITLSIFFLLFITVISSTDALIHHRIPRSQLKRRHVKPLLTAAALPAMLLKPFVPQYDWIQQDFLRAHNDFRAKVGSPPLQWDSTLAKFAHDWAVQRKNDCNYRIHSKSGKYGENIFWQLYKESTPGMWSGPGSRSKSISITGETSAFASPRGAGANADTTLISYGNPPRKLVAVLLFTATIRKVSMLSVPIILRGILLAKTPWPESFLRMSEPFVFVNVI